VITGPELDERNNRKIQSRTAAFAGDF